VEQEHPDMNREELEWLTLEQLKAEAVKYGLPVARDKRRIVDSILDHLERNTPEGEPLVRATPEPVETGATRREVTDDASEKSHGTSVSLQQLLVVV